MTPSVARHCEVIRSNLKCMKIFITGVSTGIGAALARQLLEAGHEVWGIARREIPRSGFRYSICDVSAEDQVQKVFQQMQEAGFVPEVVVLNAGIYEPDLQNGYDHTKASHLITINLFGALTWVEKFLPIFLQRNSGQFIAISSLIVFRPDIWSASYPASKAALSMAFRSMRLRYAETKVRFKTIHFGPIATLVLARYASAKASAMIPSPDKASQFIIKVIQSRRENHYFPLLPSIFIILTRWIPDRIFYLLTQHLRR